MKASSWLLMLCIGLMCFTGFGSTTSDLTENSTTDVVYIDSSESVVSISVMEITFDSHQIGAAFSLAENTADLPETEFETIMRTVLIINLPDEDVGWQSYSNYEKENHTLKNTNLHFTARKARDGIMYDSFLIS